MRSLLVLSLTACSFRGGGAPGDVGTDGSGSSDAAIDTIPPIDVMPAPSTCFGLWCTRRAITIDGTKVTGGPHADFTVLIDLPSDSALAADARDDGHDLVFTAADGMTKLAYERAQFDGVTGRLVAWVAVPSLSATTDTLIYLYWGNSGSSDQQNPSGTWDATTEAVWHLDDNKLKDATNNANDGSESGGVVYVADGKVGGAATFDGMNDAIRFPESSSLDSTTTAGTLAVWVRWTSAIDGGLQSILTSGNTFTNGGDGFSWAVQSDGDLYFYPWAGNPDNYNLGTPGFTNGAWHHIAVTYESTTRDEKIFVDGAPMAFNVVNVPTLWTTIAQPTLWHWGGNPDRTGEFFRGAMDEMRVARVVRSPGWIATEHRNQTAPAMFYTLGSVEILTP